MNSLIKKLKDEKKAQAFVLLKPEERNCLRKVGRSNCDCIVNGKWDTRTGSSNEFDPDYTYVIKPDYQLGPEYRIWECKIVVPGNIKMPCGFDSPPRRAAIEAIEEAGITVFACFSGWGGTLTKIEAGIVEENKSD